MDNDGKVNGFKPDVRKGQYILRDKKVINRQIDYAEITKADTVLEIGPGFGALTLPMAERAGKLIAIEMDSKLCSYLNRHVPTNVELICADVMKYELPPFDVVVSNLPYQISSPVTFKLLSCEFKRGILMYQREFAQRMAAKAGESSYSRLSINVYYRADCRIMEYVPKTAFFPVPEVDSAIIQLTPRSPPFKVKSEELYFALVEGLFSQRRKKIRNSVYGFVAKSMERKGTISKSRIKETMEDMPFKEERVEQLTPEDIGKLSDWLCDSAMSDITSN
ncbi:MAG: ribosomal RNA small subunit methyltransferase A [Thermoplasmata archaeon]|nr:MAG: ribosomal RNA small subunit methyltransferase A [Thermoplasmata archaeon]